MLDLKEIVTIITEVSVVTVTHLSGDQNSNPGLISCGKAGFCLPLVGSVQYRTVGNCMQRFALPFQLTITYNQ